MKTIGQWKAKARSGVLLRFAVLVPHRDTRPALYSFRRRLFAAGIPGAYSFPPVVPLALLERPLGDPELKALAVSLRALSLETGSGVFSADAVANVGGSLLLIGGPGGFSFWGLPLNVSAPSLPGSLPFPRAALCVATAGRDSKAEREILLNAGDPPLSRFRAAAAANLAIEFFSADEYVPDGENMLPCFSSRWRIGKPCWLKKARGTDSGG